MQWRHGPLDAPVRTAGSSAGVQSQSKDAMRLTPLVLPSAIVGLGLSAVLLMSMVAGGDGAPTWTSLQLAAAEPTPLAATPAPTPRAPRLAEAPPAPPAAAEGPAITGVIPADGGTALIVTAGTMTASELTLALRDRGCEPRSLWFATVAGDLSGYLPLAPQAVSSGFPDTIQPGTALMAICEDQQPG